MMNQSSVFFWSNRNLQYFPIIERIFHLLFTAMAPSPNIVWSSCGDRNVIANFFFHDITVNIALDMKISFIILKWVFKMPHFSGNFDIFSSKSEIEFKCLRSQFTNLAAIYQTFIIHFDKYFPNSIMKVSAVFGR